MNFINQVKKFVAVKLIVFGLTSAVAYSSVGPGNMDTHPNLNARFAQAVLDEDIAAMRELIEAGVNVNNPEIVNYLGRTPLHQATFIGNAAMVQLLLDQSADVHALNPSERTPLYWAAINGNEAIVHMLLIAGAEANHEDYFDRTAAFWASSNNHHNIADILNTAADEQKAAN